MIENITQTPIVITSIIGTITTVLLIFYRFKQINHSSKSIKISQIELYLKIRKELFEDRISVELMFQSLFNKALPYDEICLLFKMQTPILAIQNYIRGFDFLKIENESIIYKKKSMERRLTIYKYLYLIGYFIFSFFAGALLLYIINTTKDYPSSIIAIMVFLVFFAFVCVQEFSKVISAFRAVEYKTMKEVID